MAHKKHKLYDHFNDKEIVYVKPKAELELLLGEYGGLQKIHYLNLSGVKTEINRKLHHCCTLYVDRIYTWSYDWICKKTENHFEDDLFEL